MMSITAGCNDAFACDLRWRSARDKDALTIHDADSHSMALLPEPRSRMPEVPVFNRSCFKRYNRSLVPTPVFNSSVNPEKTYTSCRQGTVGMGKKGGAKEICLVEISNLGSTSLYSKRGDNTSATPQNPPRKVLYYKRHLPLYLEDAVQSIEKPCGFFDAKGRCCARLKSSRISGRLAD